MQGKKDNKKWMTDEIFYLMKKTVDDAKQWHRILDVKLNRNKCKQTKDN